MEPFTYASEEYNQKKCQSHIRNRYSALSVSEARLLKLFRGWTSKWYRNVVYLLAYLRHVKACMYAVE